VKELLQRCIAVLLCELLILLPATGAPKQTQEPAKPAAAQSKTLRDYLQEGYVELFQIAPQLKFSAAQIQSQRAALDQGRKSCVNRFKDRTNQYQKQLDAAQKDLKKKTAGLSDEQRKTMHCNIQNLDLLRSEAQVLANNAIPTAYENLNAKLDLIQNWPAQYQQIQQQIATKAYLNRRWGDVKDIGFRVIAANQQDDIKRGQQAVEEMKRAGLLPPEVEDKAIQRYVNDLAEKIAKNSDLKVPLHVSVLQSREINAFALPGGYLFIERGLLEAADDESELAGVIAHEIAHDAARHSNKLMKRATIASIFYQAAQVAAIILTGGVAGIGLYYAIQYGFYGLGLVLNLKLLGVSRDYELEADQLGIQYAWKAGYDPSGFVRFFDKMATKEGYVNSVSWFRTHPPFYQRMVDSEREMMFLPKNPQAIVQSSAFEAMKKELAPITAKAEKEDVNKPSLLISREEGCEPPQKIEYKSGQPIEQLCAQPAPAAQPSASPK
jgi:Zn-dependent protease with chaperone function